MDTEIVGALDAVELDDLAAQRFFETVVAAHADSDGDWDRLREHLDAARGDLPSGEVERFTEYADRNGRVDLLERMAALGADELLSAYQARRSAAVGDQAADRGRRWSSAGAPTGPGSPAPRTAGWRTGTRSTSTPTRRTPTSTRRPTTR